MTESPARTFSSDFKRFFLRGLVVLLPSVLTLWIAVKAYQFVDTTIAEPINHGVRITINNTARVWEPLRTEFDPTEGQLNARIAERAVDRRLVDREAILRQLRRSQTEPLTDEQINEELAARALATGRLSREALRTEMRQEKINLWWTERWYMNLIGLVIAIVAVYIAGRLLGGFFGRRIYSYLERAITSLPFVKQVYPYIKQIVDFLFSDEQQIKFNRVVVVEYPRKGIWSVGFMTGPTLKSVAERAGESVTVFVPSSPTPFTGYTITVPAREVIEVPISVEEAIRFAVSGGVLIPDHQVIGTPPRLGSDPPDVAEAAKTAIRSAKGATDASRTGATS